MKIFPERFDYRGHPRKDEISLKARQYYLGSDRITEKLFYNMSRLAGDAWFNLGINEAISLQVNASNFPVYAYYFSYAREYGIPNFLSRMRGISPRFLDFILAVSRTWLMDRLTSQPNTIKGKLRHEY